MKMHFNELFNYQNESVITKHVVQIGGLTLTSGMLLPQDARFGGIDFSKHSNSFFEVNISSGIYKIKKVVE